MLALALIYGDGTRAEPGRVSVQIVRLSAAKRQHLQSLLLRHGRIYPSRRPWTQMHARWLAKLTFEHPAQYLVLHEYRKAAEDAEIRLERLNQQVAEIAAT